MCGCCGAGRPAVVWCEVTSPVSAIRTRWDRMWLASVMGLAAVEMEHASVAACRGQSELVGAASSREFGGGKAGWR